MSNSMFIRLHRNGVGPLSFFKSLSHYSTAAAAVGSQSRSILDYLTNSLGFSEEEALSLSLAKKTHLSRRCRRDPDLVLNFLEKLGLNKSQIKSVVSVDPRVLSYDVDKTLQPKIRVFRDIGLSGSDLVRVIMHHKILLCRGLSTIVPAIEYLRKLLGSDENVAKVVKKFSPLLDISVAKVVSVNVELLQKAGFSNEDVAKFVLRHPRRIIRSPEIFEENLRKVEIEFGISRKSKMFYRGFEAVSSSTDSTINSKLKAFRNYGWSYANIYSMIRVLPAILSKSDAKIHQALSFYMDELGFTPEYMAGRPALFTFSLERRVKPRNEVLKILNEKKINKKKRSLYNVLCISELQFVNDYILPYEDVLPDLYESYMKSA